MTLLPPPYFEAVRRAAQARWGQLEADPELGRPWRLLFDQVKNPRHVLSELLQNADDAEATWAAVAVRDGAFEFQHNGHDFTKEDFESLCRFGLSNKRQLLTIGFRGIGFRSVFSLGDCAEVYSPTLACRFTERRFTEPEWISGDESPHNTFVRVPLRPQTIERVIAHEVEQWQASPTPLLFFNSIRRLTLGDKTIEVTPLGPGPVANSSRLQVSGIEGEVVVFRSQAEAFPQECLEEVRKERGDASLDLPPVGVVVVLGAGDAGRLYVVLPTEVELGLPVSVHAPFIQDPARTRIRQTSESSTNYWLLGRVGQLLAESMISWLGREDLPLEERAKAYNLLPASPPKGGGSLAESATDVVVEAFQQHVKDRPLLLCHTGALSFAETTVALPELITEVWGPETAREVLTPASENLLAPSLGTSSLAKLRRWDLVAEPSSAEILTRLAGDVAPPRPKAIGRLIPLWAYLDELISREPWNWRDWWINAAVVPVEGHDVLRPARRVFPGRSKPADCEQGEWEFLQRYFEVVDQEWSRLLRAIEERPGDVQVELAEIIGRRVDRRDLERVLKAFREARLLQTPGLEVAIQRAAVDLLKAPEARPTEAMALQLIAARHDLPIRLPEDFSLEFLCEDGLWRSHGDHGLVAVSDPLVSDLLPGDWLRQHAVSTAYLKDLTPEAKRAWFRWLCEPDKGGLSAFPFPVQIERKVHDHKKVSELVVQRGGSEPFRRLQSRDYRLIDWDWTDPLKVYWTESATVSERFWGLVVRGVLGSWSDAWRKFLRMDVYQLGYSQAHQLDAGAPRAQWLDRLRDLPCLPDEHGHMHVPAELLRRTPSTLPLLNVVPFVHERWDEPGFAEGLDVLGVRSSPLTAGSLIDRLRAHSGDTEFPTTMLMDLYRAIDRLSTHLDEEEQETVRTCFEEEPLVRTASGWERSRFVFLENPRGIPGVAGVHPDLGHLAGFWERLGLRREPGLDDALAWLESLPLGEQLGDKTRGGVRAILARYPDDVWKRISRWLDVQGRIDRTTAFRWGCRDRRLTVGLFPNVKVQTADLSMIDQARVEGPGLDLLPMLESLLSLRVVEVDPDVKVAKGQDHAWLPTLGGVLARLQAASDLDGEAVKADRELGRRLAVTNWTASRRVKVQPHLEGAPAGPETDVEVAWDKSVLYVCGTLAGSHRAIVKEIGRHFLTEAAQNTIRDCVGRDPAWIAAYADGHLLLEAESGLSEELERPAEPGFPGKVAARPGATAGASTTDLEGPEVPSELPVPSADERLQPAGEGDVERPATLAKPKEPTKWDRLVEFMTGRGFRWHPEYEQFIHPDGGRVQKSKGIFPWVLMSDGGERGIWLASSCLVDPNGLEIPAEVWTAGCDSHALLLEPSGESFIPHDFDELREETLTEAIDLFPSSFRLKKRV